MKKPSRLLQKLIAISLTALLLTGSMPIATSNFISDTKIVASAENTQTQPNIITNNAGLANIKAGDIIYPLETIHLEQTGLGWISQGYCRMKSTKDSTNIFRDMTYVNAKSNLQYFKCYIDRTDTRIASATETTYYEPYPSSDVKGNAWKVYSTDNNALILQGIEFNVIEVSNFEELNTALSVGGYIILTQDIVSPASNDLNINNECTIDFNGHQLTMAQNKRFTVNAPCTLKNGTLASSSNGYDASANVLADTTFDNMQVTSTCGGGYPTLRFANNCNVVIKDTTITATGNDGRGILTYVDSTNHAESVSFYGDVNIDSQNVNFAENVKMYLYGNVTTNQAIKNYSNNTTVYFCGGSVKNTAGTSALGPSLPSNKIYLENDGKGYGLYSDEACTVPMTKENVPSALAVYSKELVSLDTFTVSDIDDVAYTGSAITPAVTVTDGNTTLTQGTDYDVEYADNTDMGTATVTVTGKGGYTGTLEKNFNIFATLTEAPDGIVVYKNKTTEADKINGKSIIETGYYIVSDKALFFSDEEVDCKEYKPNASNHPFKNKDNWSKYCYAVLDVYKNVTANHNHVYVVQTSLDKLNVKCQGETGGYEKMAELTVESNNYSYGDRVDIEAKSYDVPDYGVAKEDITFGDIYFKNKANENVSTTDMPTNLGNYKVEIGADFAKNNTRYGLIKEFSIGQKDIAELVRESDTTAPKNDHIEFSLIPAGSDPLNTKTVVYNGKEYTPVIKLINYVYDYNQKKYVAEELVEGTDYTATLTPQTDVNTYTVTITAKADSVNYKGSGSIDWDITKRDFVELSVTDNRTEEEKIYDGQAVQNSEFTVTGLDDAEDTDGNPGITSQTDCTLTYKYFKLKENVNVPAGGIDELSADDFEEMPAGQVPTNAGTYRVAITVVNHNYNTMTVGKNFVIKQREVTITPKDENNIIYGDFVDVNNLKYTVTNAVEGENVQANDVVIKVIKKKVNGNPVYVGKYDILNAGKYDYELTGGTCSSDANYTLVLAENAKLTVAKKALTEEMFTVDPTTLTYNGAEQTVTVTANDSKEIPSSMQDEYETPMIRQLIAATDWEIVNNSNKGKDKGIYTVTVKATEDGNYTGELSLENKKFEIEPLDISDSEDFIVTLDPSTKVYDAQETTPTVTATYKNKTLGSDDYTVEIQSGTTVGTYNYTVTGKGNFKGTREGTWTITPADVYSLKIAGGSKIYDGTAVTKDNFRVTTKLLQNQSKDTNAALSYTYVFKNAEGTVVDQPTDAGIYTVELTLSDANGNYNAKTVSTQFEIEKRSVEIYPLENQFAEYGTPNENITVAYDYEKMEEESITGVIAGDEALAVTFANALKVDFGDNNNPAAVGFYDIVVDETVNLGNYKLVYEYPVQFEITKATLNPDWFTLYQVSEDGVSATTPYSEDGETFTGTKIIVVPRSDLVEGRDYTVSGETSAYLDGEYTIDIKGKGNYKGTVIKTWKVNPNKDVKAHTVVEETYTYDGNTPEVTVVENDGSAPLPELSQTTYKYWQKVDGNWTEIALPPVDAGEYKVQGVVTAKGYEIEVTEAEFIIEPKEIVIVVDPKDLTGTYGQTSYTIPYTYDAESVIARDRGTVTVSGEIVVTVGENGVGNYDLDYSGVAVNSDNYKLVFPSNVQFTLNKKEIQDSDIVFDNATVALQDLGTSTTSFKVVVDGKELVEGRDYEVAGTTEADEAGSYEVQVTGKGNYVGFARATWTAVDDPTARAEAVETIRQNVTVMVSDDVSAKLSGGKKRITATVNTTANDGYTVTKTGFVYMSAADYTDADSLVIGGTNVTNTGRNGAVSYTYGMIDPTGAGIYVRGYSIVNNGAYETVVYTDLVELVYDRIVRYNVSLTGGTFMSQYPEGGYSGEDIQNNKPVVKVSADPAADGEQFYCWEKNGVVVSYNKVFSFYMTEKNSDLKAVYIDADEELEERAATYVESVTPVVESGKKKITYVTVSSVPMDAKKVINAGLIFTINEAADTTTLTTANPSASVRGQETPHSNYRYSWKKGYTDGDVYYVRAYVKYESADGTEKEAYGEEVYKVTFDGYELIK